MYLKLMAAVAAAGTPLWISSASACDLEGKAVVAGHGAGCAKAVQVEGIKPDGQYAFVISTAEGEPVSGAHAVSGGNVQVVNDGRSEFTFVSDEEPGATARVVIARTDGGSGAQAGHAIVKLSEGMPINPDGGWMGVSVKGVSEETADQLDIEGRGVQILNVIKDGPAELAGLKGNDIIMTINGDSVPADVAKLVEMVSSHEPGEVIDVGVLRDGVDRMVAVELGKRAEMQQFDWRFDTAPFAEIEENFKIRGKMLRRTDDGEWVFGDLGEIEELENLPNMMFLPKGRSSSTRVWVHGDQKTVTLDIKTDEGTMSISQENGGEITVARTDADGRETVDTYADEAALEAGDAEAYEHYSKAGKPVIVELRGEGGALSTVELGDVQLEWREDLEAALEDAMGSYDDALSKAHEAVEEAVQVWRDRDGNEFNLRGIGALHFGKPKHTFSVEGDGVIVVTIRDGDSELVRRFDSEDDLAARRPELYEKYAKLLELDGQ